MGLQTICRWRTIDCGASTDTRHIDTRPRDGPTAHIVIDDAHEQNALIYRQPHMQMLQCFSLQVFSWC
jgi:hypothetical protein